MAVAQQALEAAERRRQELNDALDELQSAKIIRYAGYDEDDAIGHCYEIR